MNTKIRNCCAATMLLTMNGWAYAQDARLELTGRLLPTACTLVLETVEMGTIPFSDFTGGPGGEKHKKNFQVAMTGCDLQTLNSASLEFSGTTVSGSNDLLLALTQDEKTAQGFGISIVRIDTTHPGQGLSVVFNRSESIPLNVLSGKASYDFSAKYSRVQGISPRAGSANATATVTLAYS